MALGGIILYLQFQNSSGSVASVPILRAGGEFSAEIRVRFPSSTNDNLTPTELSGALFTLSVGSSPAGYLSVWYEKASAASTTGTVYVTSSAGRLELPSVPIFDDRFYNISLVRENSTGSLRLSTIRYEADSLTFSTSSVAPSGSTGFAPAASYDTVELGSSALVPSRGQFWAQEFRLWTGSLRDSELHAHARHFESYGREISYDNRELLIHWRLADGVSADSSGSIYLLDSTPAGWTATGSNFIPNRSPFTKFLEDYAYIPSIDYGWNQEKVRTYTGTTVDPLERYEDERFVSLEFNMFDALNEDISHLMASYDELNNILGHPMNRYRHDYEGLQQMRETYFKRFQGQLNFRAFVDMLDFFDSSFVTIVQRLIPARSIFKGDEIVVESHMLERPKYTYGFRPIREGIIDISGSISIVERNEDW